MAANLEAAGDTQGEEPRMGNQTGAFAENFQVDDI